MPFTVATSVPAILAPAPSAAVPGAAASPATSSAAAADAAYLSELGRIAALGTDLSRKDVESLYRFLARRSHPVLGEVEFHAVKNEALDKLLDQSLLPADLGRTLVALFRDRRNADLLRDYSVQHFEPYLRQLSVQGAFDPSSADVAAVRAAYRAALGETGSTLAGVALLGLERATASDASLANGPDRALALAAAVRLAGDPACDPRSRLAAVQVCAVSGQTDALPAIRALASDPAATTALRAAAFHALGELGGAPDLAILRAPSSGPSPLRTAAAAAAKRLGQRTATAN